MFIFFHNILFCSKSRGQRSITIWHWRMCLPKNEPYISGYQPLVGVHNILFCSKSRSQRTITIWHWHVWAQAQCISTYGVVYVDLLVYFCLWPIHYGSLVAFIKKLYVESTPHLKCLWLDGDIPASNKKRKKIIIIIEAMLVYSLPRSNKRVASFNDDIVITEFHFYYSIYNVYISYLNTSAPDNAITASTRHGTLVSSGPREGTMCAQISPSVSGSISHCQSR